MNTSFPTNRSMDNWDAAVGHASMPSNVGSSDRQGGFGFPTTLMAAGIGANNIIQAFLENFIRPAVANELDFRA